MKPSEDQIGSQETVLLDKEYHGFESWADIDRDISEMWDRSGIPGEGHGKIIVTIVYVEES